MLCKYCKSKKHVIDDCHYIICKLCKQKGHPNWKCNIKNNTNKNINTNVLMNKIDNNINTLEDLVQYMDKPWYELL